MKKIRVFLEMIYFWMLSIYIWQYTIFGSLAWNDKYKIIMSNVSALFKMALVILFVIFFTIIMISNKRNNYLISFIIIFLFYLSSRITKDDTLVWGIILLFFSKVSSFEKVVELYFKNTFLCLITIIVLYFTNVTYDAMSVVPYANGNSVGTGHSNVIAALLVNVILNFIYIYLKEKRCVAALVSIISACIIWKITYSRTSTILLIVFSLLLLIYDIMLKTRTQNMIKILKILIGLIVGSSIYFMLLEGKFLYINNSSFSVRFSQAHIIFERYGIKLFGNNIEFISTIEANKLGIVALILDNAYLRLLLYYGIIPALLFLIIIFFILKNTIKKKDYILLIMLSTFIIGGFMEKYILLLNMNFTLFGILKNRLKYERIGDKVENEKNLA